MENFDEYFHSSVGAFDDISYSCYYGINQYVAFNFNSLIANQELL